MKSNLNRIKKLEQIRNIDGQLQFILIDNIAPIVFDGVEYESIDDITERSSTTYIMIVEDKTVTPQLI